MTDPSIAAHNLVRYRRLIQTRADAITELHTQYAHLPAPRPAMPFAEAEALTQARHAYLRTARHLGNIEAELPNAIMRLLRFAEARIGTPTHRAA